MPVADRRLGRAKGVTNDVDISRELSRLGNLRFRRQSRKHRRNGSDVKDASRRRQGISTNVQASRRLESARHSHLRQTGGGDRRQGRKKKERWRNDGGGVTSMMAEGSSSPAAEAAGAQSISQFVGIAGLRNFQNEAQKPRRGRRRRCIKQWLP